MKSRRQRKSQLSDQGPVDALPEKVRAVALGLLARREHSRLELRHKLAQRGFAPALIEAVLERLGAEDLLSDARFAEVYAYSRADRGYGPARIAMELRGRGVSQEIIAGILEGLDEVWMPKLVELHRKRFAALLPREGAGRARQIGFLRQRGFTLEQIKRLFRNEQDDQ